MEDQQYKFGMIGLGTMGCNLVLNMSDHGFSVAGYDKSQSQVDHLNKLAENRQVKGFNDMAAFVSPLPFIVRSSILGNGVPACHVYN